MKINLKENLHLFSLWTAINLLRKISGLRLIKTVISKWKFLYSYMSKKTFILHLVLALWWTKFLV